MRVRSISIKENFSGRKFLKLNSTVDSLDWSVRAMNELLVESRNSTFVKDVFFESDSYPYVKTSGGILRISLDDSGELSRLNHQTFVDWQDDVECNLHKLTIGDRTCRQSININKEMTEESYRFRLQGAPKMNSSPNGGYVSLRPLKDVIDFNDLDLHPITEQIKNATKHTHIIAGTMSNGKSTSASSVISEIVSHRPLNICTVENPIEYWMESDSKHGVVSQFELGTDFETYLDALKSFVRFSADAIFLGEVSDPESMEAALLASKIGVLFYFTIHTNHIWNVLDRLMGYLPHDAKRPLTESFCEHLGSLSAQRLIQSSNGGSTPIQEILLLNDRDRAELIDCIRKDGSLAILVKRMLANKVEKGEAVSFEAHLKERLNSKKITKKIYDDELAKLSY